MAKITLGIDLSGRTLSINIPSTVTIASTKTIFETNTGVKLVEMPVSGGKGKLQLMYGSIVNETYTLGANGYSGTFTMWGANNYSHQWVKSIDTTAQCYQYITRNSNEKWYDISEDGGRMERVKYLGIAAMNATTVMSLKDRGDYLVVTMNRNTTAAFKSLWVVMTNGVSDGFAQRISPEPDSQIGVTGMTVDGVFLRVTVTGTAPVRVYAIKLGDE